MISSGSDPFHIASCNKRPFLELVIVWREMRLLVLVKAEAASAFSSCYRPDLRNESSYPTFKARAVQQYII